MFYLNFIYLIDIIGDNCYNKCIEKLYYNSYNCLPNPYINENFILYNASQTEYRICNNSDNYYVNESYCRNSCIKKCHQIYYSLEFESNLYFGSTDSRIRISYKNLHQFYYKSDAKYSFVDYMSNMGGLVGLWFGFAFIDISALIRVIIKYVKIIINTYIIVKLYQIIKLLKKVLSMFEGYNWKKNSNISDITTDFHTVI